MTKPRRGQPKKTRSKPAPRFADCVDCRFYKPENSAKACIDCTIGENFEAVIEELDPYADRFLSRRDSNS